jgi:acyl dehydratase
MRQELTLEAFRALVGQEIGVSSWIVIDQATIDRFADLTADHQFIHVDPVRAACEGPFGGTVAHGFLTLSMLSRMITEIMPTIAGTGTGVNYGFDKLRFIAPVRSGARIRGRFVLASIAERSFREIQFKHDVTVEIEGEAKPALVAEWLGLRLLA